MVVANWKGKAEEEFDGEVEEAWYTFLNKEIKAWHFSYKTKFIVDFQWEN